MAANGPPRQRLLSTRAVVTHLLAVAVGVSITAIGLVSWSAAASSTSAHGRFGFGLFQLPGTAADRHVASVSASRAKLAQLGSKIVDHLAAVAQPPPGVSVSDRVAAARVMQYVERAAADAQQMLVGDDEVTEALVQDGGALPGPSAVFCRMLPDGFEICEYSNACVDVTYDRMSTGMYLLTDMVEMEEVTGIAKLKAGVPSHSEAVADAIFRHETFASLSDVEKALKRPGAAGAADRYARRGGAGRPQRDAEDDEQASSSSKAADGVDVRPLDEWLHGHAEAKSAGLAERVYPWGMPLSFFLEGPGARQGDDAASGLGLRLVNPGPFVYETAVRHGIEAAERQRDAPPWVRQPLPGQPGYGSEGNARVLRDGASVGSSDGVYGTSPLLPHTYSRRLQAWNQKVSILKGPPPADGSSVPHSPADDMSQYARVPPLWDGDESTQYDLNFVDVRAPQSGTTPRVMPMTPPLEVYAAPRGMGLPTSLGGLFPGAVTWLDSTYVTHSVLGPHIWGWASSVTIPLLTALWANASMGLDLPPLDNLYIAPRWAEEVKFGTQTGGLFDEMTPPSRWSLGFLRRVLQYASARGVGRHVKVPRRGVEEDMRNSGDRHEEVSLRREPPAPPPQEIAAKKHRPRRQDQGSSSAKQPTAQKPEAANAAAAPPSQGPSANNQHADHAHTGAGVIGAGDEGHARMRAAGGQHSHGDGAAARGAAALRAALAAADDDEVEEEGAGDAGDVAGRRLLQTADAEPVTYQRGWVDTPGESTEEVDPYISYTPSFVPRLEDSPEPWIPGRLGAPLQPPPSRFRHKEKLVAALDRAIESCCTSSRSVMMGSSETITAASLGRLFAHTGVDQLSLARRGFTLELLKDPSVGIVSQPGATPAALSCISRLPKCLRLRADEIGFSYSLLLQEGDVLSADRAMEALAQQTRRDASAGQLQTGTRSKKRGRSQDAPAGADTGAGGGIPAHLRRYMAAVGPHTFVSSADLPNAMHLGTLLALAADDVAETERKRSSAAAAGRGKPVVDEPEPVEPEDPEAAADDDDFVAAGKQPAMPSKGGRKLLQTADADGDAPPAVKRSKRKGGGGGRSASLKRMAQRVQRFKHRSDYEELPQSQYGYFAKSERDAGSINYTPKLMCARRLVMLGDKYHLNAGSAEGNFVRKFAQFAAAEVSRARRRPIVEQDASNPLPPLKILLTDRATPADNRHSSSQGRYMSNRHEVEAVLAKYELPFTFAPDEDLAKMTFEQQVHLFATHSLLITGHGAGMTTNLFMPPRSVIIEISPFNVYCPAYKRMHDAAGHTILPIYSIMKSHNLDYLHSHGPDPNVTAVRELQDKISTACDHRGLMSVLEPDCWTEFVQAGIAVPIHEFEQMLLLALEHLGHSLPHRHSATHMLHGVPGATCVQRPAGVTPPDAMTWRDLNDCDKWSDAAAGPPLPTVTQYADYERRMWRLSATGT